MSRVGLGFQWATDEWGISRDSTDSEFTEDQVAILMDWDSIVAILRADYYDTHLQPLADQHIRVWDVSQPPLFPHSSEIPFLSGVTISEPTGTGNTRTFTVSLDSRPLLPITAVILKPPESHAGSTPSYGPPSDRSKHRSYTGVQRN